MEHGCFAHFGGRMCDASQRINEDASNSKHLPGALEDITDKENSNFRYASYNILLVLVANIGQNSEIVVPDNKLQDAFKALRDARFLNCKNKRACQAELSNGSRPKPDAHLHYRGGVGRVDLYKHTIHFNFLPEPVLGDLDPGDRNYMLLSDGKVPLLKPEEGFRFAPLVETLPQFKDSQGPLCGRRVNFYAVPAPLLVRSISSWSYQFYHAVKYIYKLDRAIYRAKDDGVRRNLDSKRDASIDDAWLWFVYLNAIVWLYRHHQNDNKRGHKLSWNQIMRGIDQNLVPWLNDWNHKYLVTDSRDKEANKAKFEKCLTDVTKFLTER
ncbi:hypothetical protein BDV36DRAFT_307018 [Aspergillus pseudocaelatus]|uniref:Fungal-type protein kinase domain-containing protein n=1 Tax=Aspergillus pseudocaelatus TaxID=1825620 RepID=A0ABQ6WTB4_9EURO|nr:hypothetical protein BDV36DRAFT_307018 [Aspergillus pseudocaelatus]